MGELPLDARQVVDELRARRQEAGSAPRSWVPSQSFEQTFEGAARTPVGLNVDLQWLHEHWDLSEWLASPPARGIKGAARRICHRIVLAAIGPYLGKLQDYLAVNVRAVAAASRGVDDQGATQLRFIGAIRHDLIDFAHHVDEHLGE